MAMSPSSVCISEGGCFRNGILSHSSRPRNVDLRAVKACSKRTGRQPTKITWKSPVSKTSGEYMLIRAPKPPK